MKKSKKKGLMEVLTVPIAALMLTGCISSGGVRYPVETFNRSCDRSSIIPYGPSCLEWARSQGGFKNGSEFQACKQSVLNYTSALDELYNCQDMKLKATFDDLLVKVPATYNCYVEFFQDKREGEPSSDCPPVDVPHFPYPYEADGLEINLGVPQCVRQHEGNSFAPKRAYELDDCRKQLEVFAGEGLSALSWEASSAQYQYDTFLGNLRDVLDRKADETVAGFNCYAEGREYCW